ncbi:MAG: ferrous iron transport protein B [Firmicutes bacterium]|nr:ferrous iron transport protein B [Bacillota bacterium]
MSLKFALVGNPNSGKTSLFNELTGSTQYVGNWPGVTVEKKEGKVKRLKEDVKIIDLPGIYSLSPYSLEEVIARDYLLDEKPDVVINIVDATNIERNLYLTTQLMEFGLPVVVALNMMDEIEAQGDKIDIQALERTLGIPFIPTVATKGKGINELLHKALQVAKTASAAGLIKPSQAIFPDKIEQNIKVTEKILISHIKRMDFNPRWVVLKLLENDEKVFAKINASDALLKAIKPYRENLEREYDSDVESIFADERYRYISQIVSKTVKRKRPSGALTVSDKIDRIVTNRILAIPLFLAIMYTVFRVTFGTVGTFAVDYIEVFFNEKVVGLLSVWLEAAGAADWLHSLVIDGVVGGVGSVLIYVPQIMILFFFLAILEDSGYMARAAFIMDYFFKKLGLSGKSFIPMLLGFGCSVPAVMATRTLEDEKDRRLTIILTPFMSCGAKLPVYALFAAAFFATNQSRVVFSIYLLGILVAILSGVLLKKTVFKGKAAPFVMELPPYRIPTLKSLMIHMWDRSKDFITKAGTVIFAAAVLIWFLQSFNFSFQMVEDPARSILGVIGAVIAPIFAPLGFGDWRSAVAILAGLLAKEVVVTTLGILLAVGEVAEGSVELISTLQTYFTPLKAYAFMAFTLLYMPCIAAFGAIKREMNSWKWAWFAVGYQTVVAWLVAFLIYQIGSLFGLG